MRKLRRALLHALAAVALVAAAPNPTPTPDHHDRKPADTFRLQPLPGGVYALYGRGGNIGFFVGSDAVVMVDSEFKDIAPGILAQIRSVTDKPIRYLVNTHHHGDHTGGNEAFREFAVIIAHDSVRRRMLESPQRILAEYPKELEEARKAGNAEDVKFLEDAIAWAKKVKVEEIAAPVVTFDSELRIHLEGETVEVWHTPPAHTDGDSVVYFTRANVVHMGDLYFHDMVPFIDVRSGGSARGYLAAIDGILARVPSNVTVIPGHGEVSDLAGLKAARQFVADLLEAARAAKAAGRTKEQFVSSVDLAAYRKYEGYKDRFKECAAIAYDEVVTKP